MQENLGVECPVAPGEYTITKTFALPMELPGGMLCVSLSTRYYADITGPATYTIQLLGQTVDGGSLMCLDMKAAIA